MAGSGILRGLLILAVQLGLITEGTGTYTILYTLSMSVFYFLPVLLGFSSGKRFGASPYLSALICACLLYPDFIGLMGDAGNGAMSEFFGIPGGAHRATTPPLSRPSSPSGFALVPL